jgi:hypothetical protein
VPTFVLLTSSRARRPAAASQRGLLMRFGRKALVFALAVNIEPEPPRVATVVEAGAARRRDRDHASIDAIDGGENTAPRSLQYAGVSANDMTCGNGLAK